MPPSTAVTFMAGGVRQLRHCYFGPFLTHFSALTHRRAHAARVNPPPPPPQTPCDTLRSTSCPCVWDAVTSCPCVLDAVCVCCVCVLCAVCCVVLCPCLPGADRCLQSDLAIRWYAQYASSGIRGHVAVLHCPARPHQDPDAGVGLIWGGAAAAAVVVVVVCGCVVVRWGWWWRCVVLHRLARPHQMQVRARSWELASVVREFPQSKFN